MSALEAALDIIDRGWAPLPVPFKTKVPTITDWPALRITKADAPEFFNGSPQNVGVILGEASNGLTDVDLDCPQAIAVAPYLLPKTEAIFGRTSARNSHWLYQTDLAMEFAGAALKFSDPEPAIGERAVLVELRIGGRESGAQSIVPGSTHESDEVVKWELDGEPAAIDGRELQKRVQHVAAAALLARHWLNGTRHNTALTVGGVLARAGWGVPAIKLFTEAVAKAADDTEVANRIKAAEDAAHSFSKGGKAYGFKNLSELVGERAAKRICDWLGYEPGSGANTAAKDAGDNQQLITEDEAALRFAEAYRGRLRFCHDHGAWFEWTGSIWRRNGTGLAFHYARELARKMAEGEPDKFKISASKAAFAGNVEKFAKADPVFAVTAEKWDRDPFLLGTPNGTVDLKTGILRPARPEDGITRSVAVTPAPTADCPLWRRFLDETTGSDAEMVRFIQQWAGYSLTGDTREHALVFVFGSGGNGKSVYVHVKVGILGDYATTASMDVFIASNGDRHPTDLAMLRGARLVTASETEEGRQWAESRIK